MHKEQKFHVYKKNKSGRKKLITNNLWLPLEIRSHEEGIKIAEKHGGNLLVRTLELRNFKNVI